MERLFGGYMARRLIYTAGLIFTASLGIFLYQNSTSVTKPKFLIYAQIGYMPDTVPDKTSDYEILRARIEGWNFASPPGDSPLSYWPKRPLTCALRFKWLEAKPGEPAVPRVVLGDNDYGIERKEACSEEILNYFRKLKPVGSSLTPKEFMEQEKQTALDLLLARLKVKEDQENGKKEVTANMLITSKDFFYVSGYNADKVDVLGYDLLDMVDAPDEIKVLERNGINLDRAMIYNERGQLPDGVPLVPLVRGKGVGKLEEGKFCPICLPNNPRLIDMFADSLRDEKAMTTKAMYNMRVWNTDMEKNVMDVIDSPNFGGVNFEGSTGKIGEIGEHGYGVGAVWLLQNLKKGQKINYLIPGYVEPSETKTQRQRDVALNRNLIRYVRVLNDLMVAEMTRLGLPVTTNPICNPKIVLTVASYGTPLRIDFHPAFRKDASGANTHRAGTVMGMVLELSEYRKQLCGSL